MTVTYSDKSFLRLLFHWHGSVWKAVRVPYLVFLVLYFALNVCYRYAFTENMQISFERCVQTFEKWTRMIPIQFLLGFYVSNVVNRWWDQLSSVAWPDKFLIFVVSNIHGQDEESRLIRHTFARYSNLLTVLVWKEISVKIKKRFPTDQHLLKAGLMTEEEFKLFQETTAIHGRWFVPVSWMINLLARCKQEGRISDYSHMKILEILYSYRTGSAMLTMYDWINIPLVYTQVVTLATYGYFAFCLVARQSLRNDSPVRNDTELQLYFPIYTTLEFLFYVGWLKVGEELRCPFGEDDEDFDMNYVLDRNVHVANMLVEELHNQRPALTRDRFMDKLYAKLPHTKASIKVADKVPNWRLAKFKVKDEDMEVVEEEEPAKDADLKVSYRSASKSKDDSDEAQILTKA